MINEDKVLIISEGNYRKKMLIKIIMNVFS